MEAEAILKGNQDNLLQSTRSIVTPVTLSIIILVPTIQSVHPVTKKKPRGKIRWVDPRLTIQKGMI